MEDLKHTENIKHYRASRRNGSIARVDIDVKKKKFKDNDSNAESDNIGIGKQIQDFQDSTCLYCSSREFNDRPELCVVSLSECAACISIYNNKSFENNLVFIGIAFLASFLENCEHNDLDSKLDELVDTLCIENDELQGSKYFVKAPVHFFPVSSSRLKPAFMVYEV